MSALEQDAISDDLYAELSKVVHKRKKYPARIAALEKAKFEKEIENVFDAKVQLDDSLLKEVEFKCQEVNHLFLQLPTSTAPKENQLRFKKTLENHKEILRFLELTKR